MTDNGGVYGIGAFFELDPPKRGQANWTEQVLHSFGASGDGSLPLSGPVESNGTFYGVTFNGGKFGTCPSGCGTAFELKP